MMDCALQNKNDEFLMWLLNRGVFYSSNWTAKDLEFVVDTMIKYNTKGFERVFFD